MKRIFTHFYFVLHLLIINILSFVTITIHKSKWLNDEVVHLFVYEYDKNYKYKTSRFKDRDMFE